MKHSFSTTKAAHLENLAPLRDFIDEAAAQCALDSEVSFALKLSADEACTNIIEHGYAGMDPGSIIVDLEIDERQAQMRITDFGRAFEPSTAPRPDLTAPLEDRKVGGLGLFMIYTTMDAVDYVSGETGNTLTLTKLRAVDA